jgi:signal transduction histidine kinase
MNTHANKPLILVVDDNSINIQIVCQILSVSIECSLAVATNGLDAIEFAQTQHPHLILLDIMMPGMNGYEVCKALKKAPKTQDIPVIFLTAKADESDISQGFTVGAADYIEKPIRPLELLARVNSQLRIVDHLHTIEKHTSDLAELIHVLCHDLGNSIHAGRISMEIIGEELTLDEEDRKFWNMGLGSLNNGIDVIAHVRQMRAIAEGKTQLVLTPLSLSELIKEALSIVDSQLRKKTIQIKNTINPNHKALTEYISFINSVVVNLLTNAIKFSSRNAVIYIHSEAIGNEIELTIRDTGIGIPDTLLENLFSLNKSTTRLGTEGEQGTGFGMPLVKKYIELYGGTITVESKDEMTYPNDHGTTFRIRLPQNHPITTSK